MGVVTWDGSASTDYGTAANWDSGVVPSASSNVVIPDTSSINNCILDTARTVNSFRIDANGTFDGDGNLLTVDSEGDATTGASEDYAVNIDGIIAGTDTDIQITTPATTKIDLAATSGSIRHLTINHASCVAQMYSDVSLSGNLTITAGQLTTGVGGYGYSNLTVTGTTVVSGTLTCNSSTISLGATITGNAYGLNVASGGTFTGGTGANHYLGPCNLQSSTTLTTGTTTIATSAYSDNRAIWLDTSITCPTDSILKFTGTEEQNIAESGSDTAARTLAKVVVDKASNKVSFVSGNPIAMTCQELTITSGEFDTGPDDVALTVTGDVSVTGTLTGNASAISMGSLTINSGGTYAATSGTTTIKSETSGGSTYVNDGTFTHNNGTLLLHADIPDTQVYAGSSSLYNLTSSTGNNVWLKENITIANDLTVTSGTFGSGGGNDKAITVTGDVSITGGELGNGSETGAYSFGSLTIASGATYSATSGTTTITAKTSDNYGIKGGGTFTHNNGEVKVTGNAFRFPIGVTYYDFTWDTSSEPCYLYSTTLSGGATIDGTQNAGYTAILGTLKINDRGFLPYSATKVFINNLIIGDTTDSANATTFDMQDSDVFDGDVIVNNILINADGQLKFGDNHAGKSDALEVRGAFRSLGGASGVVVV